MRGYFDATKQVEFLYECFYQALHHEFPEEILYLERYDAMKDAIKQKFGMPDTKISLLLRFLDAQNGKLSQRARQQEFAMLSADECQYIEELYVSIFKV